MVNLKEESPISKSKYPKTHEWDTLRRKNHNNYEKKITTYLQNFQTFENSLIYSKLHPLFTQRQFLDLQITKNLQKLGNYKNSEIEEYKKINPKIEKHLKKTFQTNFPIFGISAGILLQIIPIKFKMSLMRNFTLFATPVFVNVLADKMSLKGRAESREFLEWALARRVAEVGVEIGRERVCGKELERFRGNFGEGVCVNGLFKDFLRF